MVPRVDIREPNLHGLSRVQSDLGTRGLFIALFVLTLLLLAAIAAPPARANSADGTGGSIDEAIEVGEATTSTATHDEAAVTVDETSPEGGTSPDGALGEEVEPGPPQHVWTDLVPSVAHKAVEVATKLPPVTDEAIEVAMDAVPVMEEVLEAPPPELPLAGAAPEVEIAEEVQPPPEMFNEDRPVVVDVVIIAPTEVVGAVPVPPLFVPAAIASPGSEEASTVQAMSTISTRESVVVSQAIRDGSRQIDGLFSKELVAEMTLLHLTDLPDDSAETGSTSPAPEPEPAPLVAHVPIAGAVPVIGGVGASSAGSSPSGSSSFVDAFDFFAAMAALLALCLLGLIRDRSRSGRSIFPSHGGRPG